MLQLQHANTDQPVEMEQSGSSPKKNKRKQEVKKKHIAKKLSP